jgi:hypothetical protein
MKYITHDAGITKATRLTVNGWAGVKQTSGHLGDTVTYPVSTDGKELKIKNLPSWITVSNQSLSSITLR